jgi:hypothetical protein
MFWNLHDALELSRSANRRQPSVAQTMIKGTHVPEMHLVEFPKLPEARKASSGGDSISIEVKGTGWV